jgi:hypothetical protein
MTGAQIAKRFGVATKTVTNDWAKDGCPRNPDKSFDLDKVVAWRKAKLQAAADDPSVRIQANKSALQAKRLMLQCEVLETQILREKNKLHDRDACAASLVEVRASESRVIGSVSQSFKGAFPEASPAMSDWLAKWAREILSRLNSGGK